ATLYPPVTACTSAGSLPASAAEKSAWYFSAAPSATAAQQTAAQAPLLRILASLKRVEVLAGRDVEHAVGGDGRRVDGRADFDLAELLVLPARRQHGDDSV